MKTSTILKTAGVGLLLIPAAYGTAHFLSDSQPSSTRSPADTALSQAVLVQKEVVAEHPVEKGAASATSSAPNPLCTPSHKQDHESQLMRARALAAPNPNADAGGRPRHYSPDHWNETLKWSCCSNKACIRRGQDLYDILFECENHSLDAFSTNMDTDFRAACSVASANRVAAPLDSEAQQNAAQQKEMKRALQRAAILDHVVGQDDYLRADPAVPPASDAQSPAQPPASLAIKANCGDKIWRALAKAINQYCQNRDPFAPCDAAQVFKSCKKLPPVDWPSGQGSYIYSAEIPSTDGMCSWNITFQRAEDHITVDAINRNCVE